MWGLLERMCKWGVFGGWTDVFFLGGGWTRQRGGVGGFEGVGLMS